MGQPEQRFYKNYDDTFSSLFRNGDKPVSAEPVVLARGDFSAGLTPPTIVEGATWSYWSGGEGFSITVEDGAVKMVYPATEGGANGLNLDLSSLGLKEVFIEFRQKMTNPHAVKNCKIFGINSDTEGPGNYANATFGLSGGGEMTQSSFGDGTYVQNDTANVVNFDGSTPAHVGRSYPSSAIVQTPQDVAFSGFDDGEWHRIRIHHKFNDGDSAETEIPNGESFVEIDGAIYNDTKGLFNRHWSNQPIERIVWGDYAQDNDYGFTTYYKDHIVSTGGFVEASFTPLLSHDFSDGVVGEDYPSFYHSGVYTDSHPGGEGKAVRIDLNVHNPVDGCGGDHYYGGRSQLPIDIPEGKTIWFMFKRYHPSTQTWGYCYGGAGDADEAAGCGKERDGNDWLKDMVLAPVVLTSRIYLSPGVHRRDVSQRPNMLRIISEEGPLLDDSESTDATFPLDEWFTTQIMVKVASDGTGIMRAWINNKLIVEVFGPNTSVGNAMREWGLGDYWNGVPYTDGAANRDHFWIKNVVIATDVDGYGAPSGLDENGNVYIDPTPYLGA